MNIDEKNETNKQNNELNPKKKRTKSEIARLKRERLEEELKAAKLNEKKAINREGLNIMKKMSNLIIDEEFLNLLKTEKNLNYLLEGIETLVLEIQSKNEKKDV